MGVPCALHSAAVCSSGRATQRRRGPGSCRWIVPGTQAPSDAGRGWGRCTSPVKAGPAAEMEASAPRYPPGHTLLLGLCPLPLTLAWESVWVAVVVTSYHTRESFKTSSCPAAQQSEWSCAASPGVNTHTRVPSAGCEARPSHSHVHTPKRHTPISETSRSAAQVPRLRWAPPHLLCVCP